MFRATLDVRGLVFGWGLVIASWCTLSYALGVPEYLLASPGRVVGFAVEHSSSLLESIAITGSQALVGWCLATLAGILVGAIVFYLPAGRTLLLPPLIAVQTIPVIALAPLITFWFGYGWTAKVVVVIIIASFPVTLATFSGLSEANKAFLHLFSLQGVGARSIFWEVRFPSAWMSVLPALKVSAVFAVIGSIVAEFMGGTTGLGFLIMKAVYSSRGAMLISAVLASALLGQLFVYGIERGVRPLERRWGHNA